MDNTNPIYFLTEWKNYASLRHGKEAAKAIAKGRKAVKDLAMDIGNLHRVNKGQHPSKLVKGAIGARSGIDYTRTLGHQLKAASEIKKGQIAVGKERKSLKGKLKHFGDAMNTAKSRFATKKDLQREVKKNIKQYGG